MSYSSLATVYIKSPNTYGKRTGKITKLTIHHMAVVNGSLTGVGNSFAQKSRTASSTYGIDSNGKIACYLDEEYAPITSSNKANDMVAVTIEVANSKGAPNWEISDAAFESLIKLCVDVCKRNGIKEINFTGNKNGNLTYHSMFTATTCPGNYLKGKMNEIAQRINAEIKGEQKPVAPTPAPTPTPTPTSNFTVKVTADDLNIRKGPGQNYAVVGHIKDHGVYTIVEVQNTVWGKLKSGAGWICLSYTKRL